MAAEARAPAGERGTADRIEADEGMFWVRLVTWQALDREGTAMQHCVGDGDYDALVGGEDLADNSIWSLRRADGFSVLTVRVRCCVLDYARGFSNHGPGKGACLQVRHLADAFAAAGHRLAVDEDTGIVLLDDGRTFRRDRLPPEIVVAREAAEHARREVRRRMREAREETRMLPLRGGAYLVPTAPGLRSTTFRPLGDIEPFELSRGISIRIDKDRLRAAFSLFERAQDRPEDEPPAPGESEPLRLRATEATPSEVPRTLRIEAPFTSWVMESDPDGEPIGGIGLPRFEFRATRGLADPVVRIERDGEGPLRYRTRANVQFELAPDEFTRPGPGGRPASWDPAFQPAFLQRYREAVGPSGAAVGRGRVSARIETESSGVSPSARRSDTLNACAEGRLA